MARALLSAPETARSRAEMRDVLLATGLPAHLCDWLLMNLVNDGTGTLRWRIDRQALVDFGKASRGDNLWDDAEAIAPKLSVIYGDRSGFVTADDLARLRSLSVTPHALPAGHFVHVDALEPLAALLASTITPDPDLLPLRGQRGGVRNRYEAHAGVPVCVHVSA